MTPQRGLSFVADHTGICPTMRSSQHAWTIATHYSTGSATTCTGAYKPFKTPQHTSSPTREGESTSRPSCSSYIGFQSANVSKSRLPCWGTRHCTTSCLPISNSLQNRNL